MNLQSNVISHICIYRPKIQGDDHQYIQVRQRSQSGGGGNRSPNPRSPSLPRSKYGDRGNRTPQSEHFPHLSYLANNIFDRLSSNTAQQILGTWVQLPRNKEDLNIEMEGIEFSVRIFATFIRFSEKINLIGLAVTPRSQLWGTGFDSCKRNIIYHKTQRIPLNNKTELIKGIHIHTDWISIKKNLVPLSQVFKPK